MGLWRKGAPGLVGLNMEIAADIAASTRKFTEFSFHTAGAPEI